MADSTRFHRLGAVLCAIMLASVVMALGGLMLRFAPGWNPYYLVGACFLVALEAAFVQYTIRRERMWLGEGASYLVAEIAVLVVLMRVVATLSTGITSLQQDAQRWLSSPLSAVKDAGFIVSFLIAVVVALVARSSAHDLHELAPQEFEQPSKEDDSNIVQINASRERTEALAGVSKRFVWGGVLLLLALSLQVLDITRFTGTSLPLAPGVAFAALAYIICGFLLYSQARLALLQSRWRLEQTTVEPAVIRRWTRSSILLIVLLALAMLALPRTYGMGLLDTFRATMGVVGLVVVQIGYLLIWALGLLAVIPLLLLSWLTPNSTAPTVPPPPPMMPPNIPPATPGTPPLVPSLIFWACMVFLAGYAIMIVLKRHPGLIEALRLRGPLTALVRWLRLTWGDTTTWAREAAQSVGKRFQRPPEATKQRWPALRLSKLAPRELVRYFYHSTLQRAAQRGIGRNRAQTPYEYSASLTHRLPDTSDDIAALTDAFVAAEYGPNAPAPEQARGVKRHWDRLRRYLRQSNST